MLGTAHRRARQAAGFKYRPEYARAAKINKRSVLSLEQGDPVGEYIAEAVGRFLPTWTEDTPRIILEGGPIPSNDIEPVVPDVEDTVNMAINGLVDLQVHGADRATYYLAARDWAKELAADGMDDQIEYVLREADRRAADIIAKQDNPTAGTG